MNIEIDIRSNEINAKELIGSMFRYDIDKSDPDVIKNLLRQLPSLSDQIQSIEKKIDQEFITLKMEQDISHMNDNEEMAGFIDSFKTTKKALNRHLEQVESLSSTHKEIIDRFNQHNNGKKEAVFIQGAIQIYVDTVNGEFKEFVNVHSMTIEQLLQDIDKIEYIKSILGNKSSSPEKELVKVEKEKRALEDLKRYSSIYRKEILYRLSQCIKQRISVQDGNTYKNIRMIHSFFDSINEKRQVEEDIFINIIQVAKYVPSYQSKEEIHSEYLKYLLLLKNQLKNMSEGKGIFTKIFEKNSHKVFESFCSFMCTNYICNLVHHNLSSCLSSNKYVYFLELYDIFNTEFSKQTGSLGSVLFNISSYLHTIRSTFNKCMYPFSKDYYNTELNTFVDEIKSHYDKLESAMNSIRSTPHPSKEIKQLSQYISKERVHGMVQRYTQSTNRTIRHTPSYHVSDRCNSIIDSFFTYMYKYIQCAIDMVKAEILQTRDVSAMESYIYNLLGMCNDMIDIVYISNNDIQGLHSTYFSKILLDKYNMFYNEMKNELNNSISLLIERVFVYIRDSPRQPTGKNEGASGKITNQGASGKAGKQGKKTEEGVTGGGIKYENGSGVCYSMMSILDRVYREIFVSFTDSIRKKIFYNIGCRLIQHIKKIMPTKDYYSKNNSFIKIDMEIYEAYIGRMKSVALVEMFETFKKVVHILFTPAVHIETYVLTNKLYSVESKDVIDTYVQCAVDHEGRA